MIKSSYFSTATRLSKHTRRHLQGFGNLAGADINMPTSV
jgi:hypothetical protein